jgi:regulator of nonsense transcripts 3
MVDGANTKAKQQSSSNNKSFNDQNQTKIVLRRLPPTLTSEQFLDIVSPLPDHDYYRFCKADLSLGQQYAFSRAYLNIPNRQDLIVFTEKFQGYVFVDKNGNEYNCSVEYAPNQSRPKSEQQSRKDPKINSIEQDPEYQTFVANMNAPVSASEALPNAETMLEEIEKKQRDIQDSRNKSGVTTTPLLEFLKRKREERKQEKIIRSQQTQQRRNNKQANRNVGSNMNEDDYNSSQRYKGGDRSNRSQRVYEKSDYRPSNHEQKRSNANDYGGNKSSKNREQQNPKPKQQNSAKESKSSTNTKTNHEEPAAAASSQTESQTKREPDTTEKPPNDERPNSSQKNSNAPPTKNRPSIQIYNPGERVRLRKQQNPSS